MFCTRCGIELSDSAKYCSNCGAATHNAPAFRGFQQSPGGQLSRPNEGRRIAGVCAGFARYFGLDVTLVRILWVVLCFWPPCAGVLAYIVCWIVMPRDPLPVAGMAQDFPSGAP